MTFAYVISGEIEYNPTLGQSKAAHKSITTTRRLSQETLCSSGSSGDSGFFNVPTPPGSSYSSQESSSPYSLAASPQSSTTTAAPTTANPFQDLYTNIGFVEPSEDLELEKIVDDVDNMYRYVSHLHLNTVGNYILLLSLQGATAQARRRGSQRKH